MRHLSCLLLLAATATTTLIQAEDKPVPVIATVMSMDLTPNLTAALSADPKTQADVKAHDELMAKAEKIESKDEPTKAEMDQLNKIYEAVNESEAKLEKMRQATLTALIEKQFAGKYQAVVADLTAEGCPVLSGAIKFVDITAEVRKALPQVETPVKVDSPKPNVIDIPKDMAK